MNKGKVISINEYKELKLKKKSYRSKRREVKDTEEERRETLNLFMKVLETMRKESYK
ncbi:hypothetical protein [Alkaliphilus crotonatoxidans]